MKFSVKASVFITMLLSGIANANLIVNGDFESVDERQGDVFERALEDLADESVNDIYSRYDTYRSLQGWETLYGRGIEVQTTNGAVANLLKTDADFSGNGQLYVELDAEPDYVEQPNDAPGANSGMVQQLENLTVGGTYELSFWYLARTVDANDNGINVFWYDDSQSYSDNIALVIDKTDENYTDWTKFTISLEATSSSMNVGFGAFGDFWGAHNHSSQDASYSESTGNGMGGLLDNVSLVRVSEPNAVILFLLGSIALYSRKRK